MAQAIEIHVRYDTKDENGKTRRERNKDYGDLVRSPECDVPASGQYLWRWYWEISGSLRRVREEVCEPIPPSEFLAWQTVSGAIVYPSEYGILRAMDTAYCEAMNLELSEYRDRRTAAQKADLEAARRRKK